MCFPVTFVEVKKKKKRPNRSALVYFAVQNIIFCGLHVGVPGLGVEVAHLPQTVYKFIYSYFLYSDVV